MTDIMKRLIQQRDAVFLGSKVDRQSGNYRLWFFEPTTGAVLDYTGESIFLFCRISGHLRTIRGIRQNKTKKVTAWYYNTAKFQEDPIVARLSDTSTIQTKVGVVPAIIV